MEYSYEYFDQENNLIVATAPAEYKPEWGYGEISPHNAKPKKQDLVDWDGRKGHILFIRKDYDEVRVYFYDDRETEDFSLDDFHTYTRNASGRATWHI